MKPLLIALPAVALLGCVLSPPKEVAQIKPPISFEDTVMLLGEMTSKCWSSKVNPLKDGIIVKGYGNAQSDQFVISGFRLNWGIGLAKDPFIVVTVTQSNNREATVSVSEGDFGTGLMGAFRLDAAAHVPAWLNGERECKEFSKTLWHS